ncbi:hypothetical protein E2C01_077133 [Portunus trituberculatus]|uniref:Uncharacterized protein n=1 Tax=Portunus trituberculatus TaxID=210409 RepID=A0A5B7IQI8_PORTR|nr:hypothetical protein [Portunus trituberculatus]
MSGDASTRRGVAGPATSEAVVQVIKIPGAGVHVAPGEDRPLRHTFRTPDEVSAPAT